MSKFLSLRAFIVFVVVLVILLALVRTRLPAELPSGSNSIGRADASLMERMSLSLMFSTAKWTTHDYIVFKTAHCTWGGEGVTFYTDPISGRWRLWVFNLPSRLKGPKRV